jgi:hypothetical protein
MAQKKSVQKKSVTEKKKTMKLKVKTGETSSPPPKQRAGGGIRIREILKKFFRVVAMKK